MREAIIYLIAYVMTIAAAFYGERKTKVEPSRDEKEFENRMLVIATALFIFIAFNVFVRWLFNLYFR